MKHPGTERDSCITAYLRMISRYRVLTDEQHILHCRQIQEWLAWPGGADQAPECVREVGLMARNRMVQTNLRLVVTVAKKYLELGVPFQDLIQEGNVGLITACERFNPSMGYRFSTYAYWWIRQGITRYLSTNSRIIRIPVSTIELARKIQALIDEYTSQGRANELSVARLAELLGKSEDTIANAIRSRTLEPISLDGGPQRDLDVHWLSLAYADPLEATVSDDLHKGDEEDLASSILDYVEELPELEKQVAIGMGIEMKDARTLAEELMLSVPKVNKLWRSSIGKLRELAGIPTLQLDVDTSLSSRPKRVRVKSSSKAKPTSKPHESLSISDAVLRSAFSADTA